MPHSGGLEEGLHTHRPEVHVMQWWGTEGLYCARLPDRMFALEEKSLLLHEDAGWVRGLEMRLNTTRLFFAREDRFLHVLFRTHGRKQD